MWTEAYDPAGNLYFYSALGETVWELPPGATAAPEPPEVAGDWAVTESPATDWAEFVDDAGVAYWYNAATGESQY